MDTPTAVGDLHLHTTASDGQSSVQERVDQASEHGLGTIAITDHDTIAPELTRRVEDRRGVTIVTGVEVRAGFRGAKVELLGYFVDPTHDGMQKLLRQAQEFRTERNREIVALIQEELGIEIDFQELRSTVPGEVGRPHLANELVDRGAAQSVGEAFDRYLGASGSCFVDMERHPVGDAISTLHSAGGVVSLAHPGRIRLPSEEVREAVTALSAMGLDAIEVWYPYGEVRSEAYADLSVSDAAELAHEHGLIETGGSDCHGPGSGKFRIGEIRVEREHVEQLRERAEFWAGDTLSEA